MFQTAFLDGYILVKKYKNFFEKSIDKGKKTKYNIRCSRVKVRTKNIEK